MRTRRWVLCLPSLAFLSLLVGCGGGSTLDVQNQPPPQVNSVSIVFNPAPSSSIQPGIPVDVTAVVNNDSSNAGVDWIVTCQDTGNCGTLSAPHTASGQPTTYTPPSTLSKNTEIVNVSAFATADHTENVNAPITITGFGGNFNGTYILQAQGIDANSSTYQFAAAIVLDGNGGITSGEQTVNFTDPIVFSLLSESAAITGGSYFVGSDGRGTITINTDNPNVGQSGIETFRLVFLSNSQALITQDDFTATASGTMDLQTSVAQPSGGYAFVVSGTDIDTCASLGTCLPTAFGGVFNIDSPKTISGKGSVSDQNLGGTMTVQQTVSGMVSDPDAFGAVTIGLNLGFAPSPVQFTGYIVDGTHMKLIETDNSNPFAPGFGSTGGIAIGQGAATGTFKTAAALSGTYVFGIPGVDLTENFFNTAPATFTSAGVFTADGIGAVTNGFTDTFLEANCIQASCNQNFVPGAKISSAFNGTYTVAAVGTGRGRVDITNLSPKPNPTYLPAFIFYLTGNGNPALVLDVGDTSTNPFTGAASYPSVGFGLAYPQSATTPTFVGTYGISLTQQNGSETDDTGQLTADAATNTLSGMVDTGSGLFDNPLTGTFAAPAANGVFAVSLSSQAFDFQDPVTSSFTSDFFAIDANHGFFVETDLKDPNNPSSVVSFGYYAARTPVCSGCP